MRSFVSLTAAFLLAFFVNFGATSPTLADDDAKESADKSKFPKWESVVEDAKKLEGLFTLYYDEEEQKLLLEVRKDQYDKELILPIAISRGSGFYLGGDTLNFGEQWVITFHRAGDRLLVIRKNTSVRAEEGTPRADAVKLSHNDSVIYALPIKSEQSGGSKVLVDLADLLMKDLAGLGINPDRSRSTWASVKAFPNNVEIEVNAVFRGYGGLFFFGGPDTPDPRGTQIGIHYGFSELPKSNGYKPRLADDRLGHFLSVVRDYSTDADKSPSVHYVTRWRLEKSNADADKSPPKEPIIFWIEKTVPREYRPYVKAGILEWNKAFEKIGFLDAIQVRDQQSRDEFDPEDLRYNTFRWIATGSSFAMGPSRTNPKTGQILDADILFDESMIRYWRQEYLLLSGLPESVALARQLPEHAWMKLFSSELPLLVAHQPLVERMYQSLEHSEAAEHASLGDPAGLLEPNRRGGHAHHTHHRCQFGRGMQRQLGLLAAVLHSRGELHPGGKVPEEFIGQALKEVTMHEVGHTLGLRHNFKASTMLSLAECNDQKITQKKGMAGSVMDYLPANIALDEESQGDYFSQTIGPYDYWAIEYAYTPVSGDVAEALDKIASRVAEPELTYGTDEDLYMSPDPRINLYDLGDPLDYAKQRIELVQQQMDELAERVVAEGEGWQRARDAFNTMLGELSSATYLAAQYIGGEYNHRDHRGDPDARLPLEPIEVAKQREAMQFLAEHILSADVFDVSPELLKRLAPEYLQDNTAFIIFSSGYQYPYRDQVLAIQRSVISRFLSSSTLQSIRNAELHVEDLDEALQLPEVFSLLTDSIWSELPADDAGTPDELDINGMRRDLQREHVRRLAEIVLGPSSGGSLTMMGGVIFLSASERHSADAVALARHHLRNVAERIEGVLDNSDVKVSDYAQAHLEDIHAQIEKVLTASLEASRP